MGGLLTEPPGNHQLFCEWAAEKRLPIISDSTEFAISTIAQTWLGILNLFQMCFCIFTQRKNLKWKTAAFYVLLQSFFSEEIFILCFV